MVDTPNPNSQPQRVSLLKTTLQFAENMPPTLGDLRALIHLADGLPDDETVRQEISPDGSGVVGLSIPFRQTT